MPWAGGSRGAISPKLGDTYHVANLGGAASVDQDDLGAVGGVAILEVVAGGRELAGLELGSELNGGGVGGRSGVDNGGSEGEDVEELHFDYWSGMSKGRDKEARSSKEWRLVVRVGRDEMMVAECSAGEKEKK